LKKKYKPESSHYILPADAKIASAPVLSEILENIRSSVSSEITVDLSKVYWISPFTACWFAALIETCTNENKRLITISPQRENAEHQWINLGIAHYLDPKAPKSVESRYSTFPVTRLTEPSYPLAGQVTRLLTEKLRGVENFHKALHFAIREVIENTFEHGQTDHCFMCAYSVPSRQVVRLCILDTGIGIPNSMRTSQKYSSITEDHQLIESASEYGVSSKSADRGIGLYVMRDVTQKNEAQLTILSGKAKIDITKSIKCSELTTSFRGTAIELMLRTRQNFQYLTVSDWEAI